MLAASVSEKSIPILFVLGSGKHTRHVVCADGVVCLSRLIDGSEDCVDAVNASLSHVMERWKFHQIKVSLPGNGCEWSHSAIDRIRMSDSVDVILRSTVTSEQSPLKFDSELMGDSLVFDLFRLAMAPWRAPLLARKSSALSGSYSSTVSIVRKRRELLKFKLASVGSLSVALTFASYALLIGVDHARQVALIKRERGSLLSELEDMRARALGLDQTPVATSQILQQAAEIEDTMPLSGDRLLLLVATHVTDHPGIALEHIVWRFVADRKSDSRSLLVGDGALGIPEPVWFGSARSRSLTSLVEMSGRISLTGTVREAQQAIDEFVGALLDDPSVDQCLLLESPLTGAVDGPSEESVFAPTWRLRCLVRPLERPGVEKI